MVKTEKEIRDQLWKTDVFLQSEIRQLGEYTSDTEVGREIRTSIATSIQILTGARNALRWVLGEHDAR